MMWTNVLMMLITIVFFALYGYQVFANFLRLVCHTYFRRITVHGINYLPREGPVILCPNHPNMVVDALLVITECIRLGRRPYAWAKASLFVNPVVGSMLRALGGVPVFRPPKKDSLEDVDSEKTPEEVMKANLMMFKSTWDVLIEGNLVVLFPEGTSYTQPHMLNLRTGVMRVATGFVKEYKGPVSIVPLGLTYFNKDRFRSEVTLEFGKPILIDGSVITSPGFQNDDRSEIKRLTETLQKSMYSVTLNAENYETLQIARILRRLYIASSSTLNASDDVHFTQQLVNLLEKNDKSKHLLDEKVTEQVHEDTVFQSKDETLATLKQRVLEYQLELDSLRLKDSDLTIPFDTSNESILKIVWERLMYLLILLPLATPGLLLNSPFYFMGTKLNEKAGFIESKSMFKIMAGVVFVPIQWVVVLLITNLKYGSTSMYLMAMVLPVLLYSHIKVLEESRSIMQNVWFLFNIATRKDRLKALKQKRNVLVPDVKLLVDSSIDNSVLNKVQEKLQNGSKTVKAPKAPNLRTRQVSRTDLSFMT